MPLMMSASGLLAAISTDAVPVDADRDCARSKVTRLTGAPVAVLAPEGLSESGFAVDGVNAWDASGFREAG